MTSTNYRTSYYQQPAYARSRVNAQLSERNGTNHALPAKLPGRAQINALRRTANNKLAANSRYWLRGQLSDDERDQRDNAICAELQAAVSAIQTADLRATFG